MKKFLNYLGEGVPGPFLPQIRRTQTAADFDRICAEFLDHDRPMTMEPAENPRPKTPPTAPRRYASANVTPDSRNPRPRACILTRSPSFTNSGTRNFHAWLSGGVAAFVDAAAAGIAADRRLGVGDGELDVRRQLHADRIAVVFQDFDRPGCR